MKIAPHIPALPVSSLLPVVLFAAGGLAAGATAWLWFEHGASVYLTRMLDFAWTCF